MSDRQPLGNPSDLIAAVQGAATRGRGYTPGPSSGIRVSGDLPPLQGVDPSTIPRGVLAAFKYMPDFKQIGVVNPGDRNTATGGFGAGTIMRHLVSQQLVGWTRRGDSYVPPTYSTQPQDGYTGKLIGVGSAGGGDPPNPTFNGVAASDAK